jgi:hypothetical protein
MSDLKYCQGPDCHTYNTQDRVKGPQGHKTNQTRRRSSFYYGNGNFCDMRCQNDWFRKYGTQAVNHFGRINEPKHLTEHNAWTKDYDWRGNADESHRHYYYNRLTKERRPLTEAQYNDSNYTINTGE